MFIPMLSGKLSGKLSDRYGERIPFIGGFVLIFAGLMIFLQANNFFAFASSSVVFGVGGGLSGPAYQSLFSTVVPAEMLGTFSGVFESSRGFISLPAPWLVRSFGSTSARKRRF